MKIISNVLFALIVMPLFAVSDQKEDNESDFIRYVIAFNPQLLTPDIDIPFLGDLLFDLPIFGHEEWRDGKGFFEFSSLIESIENTLGLKSEALNFFSISETLNIDVRRMPPILARFIEDLPFVSSVEKDKELFISEPPSSPFSAYRGEILPYGIQMVGATAVSATTVANRKVCIIDSGYDLQHPDLPSEHVDGTESGSNGPWSTDSNGHGA